MYDARGNFELRGTIVGRHKVVGGDCVYDVQPRHRGSLTSRVCGIPGSRLRSVGKPYLAYERRAEPGPRHIADEA